MALRAETELLNDPAYQRARPRILGHVRDLHAATSLAALYKLQQALLVDFAAYQLVGDQELAQQEREFEQQIRDAVASKRGESIREAQAKLEIIKRQHRVARAVRHALRCVADGLAWKALRYDRMAIAVFGQGRRVGRLALGRGFDTERATLEAYWQHGILGIHNDLTNVLRHGDLTLVRWTPTGGVEADIEEVKAGRVNVGSPQMRRIADVMAFLQAGDHPTLAQGGRLRALRVPQKYRTHQAALGSVIARARNTGVAWEAPAPCLAIMAFDYGRLSGRSVQVAERAHAAMERRLGWWKPGRLLPILWTASLQRLNDRQHDPIASMAPLAIYKLPPEDIADVLLGFVDYVVYLNDEILTTMFARDGIAVRIARPPASARTFLTAERDNRGVGVPGAARVQMMLELMTPASLIQLVDANLKAAARSTTNDNWIVVFDDESSVWR